MAQEERTRRLTWGSPETWIPILGIIVGFAWAGVVFYIVRQRALVRLKALEMLAKELELAQIRLEERRARGE